MAKEREDGEGVSVGGRLGSKIGQGGVLGSLVALVALQGFSAVNPDTVHIDTHVKDNTRLIREVQKEQSELHYSIRALRTSVDRLSLAIEKLDAQ